MLGEEGTKIICESMKGNDTLKEINLSGDSYYGSNIGEAAGAKHVADLLRVTASLTKVLAFGIWVNPAPPTQTSDCVMLCV